MCIARVNLHRAGGVTALMDKQRLVEELLACAQDDWLALWMIAQDVEELLGVHDPNENLEVTITVVKELLNRGLRAGESPGVSAAHFVPWPDQDPETVASLIRRQWVHRGTLTGWGDSPWFCAPHSGQGGQCLS